MTSHSISEGFAEDAASEALLKGKSFESAIESMGGMRWIPEIYIFPFCLFCSRLLERFSSNFRPKKTEQYRWQRNIPFAGEKKAPFPPK
jgi:hypothetical protein